MIITWRIAVRIALILVAAVILQVSFFSYLSPFGSIPDIVPVVVVTLGLLGGAVLGAVAGFAAGFLLDSVLLQTLGVSSLALIAVGYMAGRYRESYEVSNALTPPIMIGVLSLAYAALFSAIQLMLGVSTPVSLVILRDIVVKGLLGTLLAIFTYPLVRRMVRPALIDEAVASRRRSAIRPAAAVRRRLRRRRARAARTTRTAGVVGRSG
jgi:rod shape-determining protein MreD